MQEDADREVDSGKVDRCCGQRFKKDGGQIW